MIDDYLEVGVRCPYCKDPSHTEFLVEVNNPSPNLVTVFGRQKDVTCEYCEKKFRVSFSDTIHVDIEKIDKDNKDHAYE